MNSEENANDKKVEELAEALADVVGVEEEKEEVVVEIKLDEETAVEENAVEENNSEADAVEENNIAENAVEENVQQPPKKKSKLWIVLTVSILAILGVVAGFYFGMSSRYSECFFMGTTVNGMDCSRMTVNEVGAILQKQVEEYELAVETVDGKTEIIKGTDIGIRYNGHHDLKEAFEKQNPYAWPKALFETKDIKASIDFDYDIQKLDERIAALECLKAENQVVAVSATVVYENGKFAIKEETPGTQIDVTKLSEQIHKTVTEMSASVNVEEAGCYLQPKFTKDSVEVIAARDAMNKYLTASITYSKDSVEVKLDKTKIYSWISVDDNMTPVISEAKAKEFANTLSSKYNTSNRGGQITTPTGKVVNVGLAGYGRAVGVDAETKQIISEIKEGKTVTREPIFSRQATPEGQNLWGTTYIEVDITAQHMWYIVGGEIKLETDVVTGKKGVNDTPTGTYTILEKMRNKTLRGRLVNGKPSYLTPVSYWMRVTWSGIGFHDATWQPTFGGERYVTNGSHGCINMPKDKAAQLYGMISNGTPVIIHY